MLLFDRYQEGKIKCYHQKEITLSLKWNHLQFKI